MPLTRRVSYREAWLDLSSGILLCGVYESPISPAQRRNTGREAAVRQRYFRRSHSPIGLIFGPDCFWIVGGNGRPVNSAFQLAVNFASHPKIIKLRRRLGDSAALSWIFLLACVAAARSQGVLSGMDAEDVAIAAQYNGNPEEFRGTLVDLRLLDEVDGRFQIHDWMDWNNRASQAVSGSKLASANGAAKWGHAPDLVTANQSKLRAQRLSAARKLGTHTREEFQEMVEFFGSEYLKCGSPDNISRDCIVPIYHSGSVAKLVEK